MITFPPHGTLFALLALRLDFGFFLGCPPLSTSQLLPFNRRIWLNFFLPTAEETIDDFFFFLVSIS